MDPVGLYHVRVDDFTVCKNLSVGFFTSSFWGTGIRGLMRGKATLPRLPGAISGQRQSWKTPGELGVSKSMEYDNFLFSALTLLVG